MIITNSKAKKKGAHFEHLNYHLLSILIVVYHNLFPDAEVLEDIVQRFLAADLAAGDFAQLLQYHFQIFGDDVAAHSHFHRLQYSGEGILGTEKSLVVAGTRNDDVVLGNLRNISGFYQCLLQGSNVLARAGTDKEWGFCFSGFCFAGI